MENCIKIILDNVKLYPTEYIRLKLVCDYFNSVITDHINIFKFDDLVSDKDVKVHCSTSGKKKKCIRCDKLTTCIEVFSGNPMCIGCKPVYISKTEAKKNFKLNDNDLLYIDSLQYYNRVYRQNVTFYQKCDVGALYLIKMKEIKPKRIGNAARDKRILQLNKSLTKYIPEEYHSCVKDLEICSLFLRNGNDGIRALENKLKLWNVCFPEIWPFMTEKVKIYKLYIDDPENVKEIVRRKNNTEEFENLMTHEYKTIGIEKPKNSSYYYKNSYIWYGFNRVQSDIRRDILSDELNKYGLKLRKDSSVCTDFISLKRHDLGEVIRIMREMNWLYNHTKYPGIFKNLLNIEYTRAKESIHDYYEHDEYIEILNSLVNKHKVSKEAKQLATKNITVPDYYIV